MAVLEGYNRETGERLFDHEFECAVDSLGHLTLEELSFYFNTRYARELYADETPNWTSAAFEDDWYDAFDQDFSPMRALVFDDI